MEIIETFFGTPRPGKVEEEDMPLLQSFGEMIDGINIEGISQIIYPRDECRHGAKPEVDENDVIYLSGEEELEKECPFPVDELNELFCEAFAVLMSTGRYKLGIAGPRVVEITYYAPCDSIPDGAFGIRVHMPDTDTVKLTKSVERYVEIKEATVLAEVFVKDTDGGRVPYESSTDGNDITITIDFKEVRRGIIKEFIQKLNEGEEDDN